MGDVVGCFIDVADRTISKTPIFPIIRSAGPPFFEFSRHYCCLCLYMFFFMLTWLFFLRFLVRRSNEIDLGISFEKCGLTFISEREGIREQHYISIILSIKCTSFAVSPTYCLCSNLSLAQTYKYTYINRYVIYDETYMQIISILSVFNRKVDVSWIAYKSPTEILNW